MFAKRFFQKALHQQHAQDATSVAEMDVQIAVHYGIPYTASILAFDPIQRLLAIGTLDGRIKIFGGDNIEGLLISPRKLPYKYLEFIQNQGLLVAISNENEIQVWNLEFRQLFHSSQWDVNITAFAVIQGAFLMYVGDENGLLSILKYDVDDGKLQKMPYNVPMHSLTEAAGISLLDPQTIVGILPQPYTFGSRVLIAYEKGLLVLWDVSEDHVVAVRGLGNLHIKGGVANSQDSSENDQLDNVDENEEEEREICSLCWASKTGSTVAVGYITGDILLWNLSTKSSRQGKQSDISSNVVKLQLASGNRRLPVIVLHWSAGSAADNDKGGHLFVYGGDDMGSEEVLTVLSLESTTGLDSIRCMSRLDLNLNGSFADMILIPDVGAPYKSHTAALFILTNPGQLTMYDGSTLFSVQKPEERNAQLEAQKFPVVVPTIDPDITVSNLCTLPTGNESPQILLKKFYARKTVAPSLSCGTRWPLTGGVPSEMSVNEDHEVERIYIAGYQDGSVKIWDATFPVLKLMFVLDGKVPVVDIDRGNASVSSLDFCSLNMTLAVGTESGLVLIYRLHENTGGSSFHFVSESKQEVHIVNHGRGFHCNIAFMASNSPVRCVRHTTSGEMLAVGYKNGQVAMFDASQLSILFSMDCASGTNSPVISLAIHCVLTSAAPVDSPEKASPKSAKLPSEILICLTKNAHVAIIDSRSGLMINSQMLYQKLSAISMYVIDGASYEEHSQISEDKASSQSKPGKDESNVDKKQAQGVEKHKKNGSPRSSAIESDQHLLVCCEDAVLLFSLKSLMQETSKHLHKIKLAEQCSWSAAFKKIDEKAHGLILVYQTGTIELRSVPDLALVARSSLMSTLRWSFKTGMDKSISSSNGQIALVNGSEFAIISLIASENDFRVPESLPCLHDKVLAAAAEAAINASMDQKRKQDPAAGILGGIIKGFKRGQMEENVKMKESFPGQSPGEQLEELFLKDPFSESSTPVIDDPTEELSIDDIEIDDDPLPVPASSSTSVVNKKNKTVEEERAKLFEGSSQVEKPRMRTTQEILTKYKFGGDATAAAAHARDKLVQRQEKLERISQRTAELESGAENFASLAQELAKTMENKKWWKL